MAHLFAEERRGPALPTDLLGAAAASAPRPQPAEKPWPAQNAVAETAQTYAGTEVKVDPLAMLASSRASAATAPAASSQVPTAAAAEALAPDSLGPLGVSTAPPPAPVVAPAPQEQRPQEPKAATLKASIVDTSVKDGTTWYHLRLSDPSDPRTFQKRYNDFKSFDKTLREQSAVLDKVLPQLPESGLFGFRHKLGVDDFETKRRDGLQAYLNAVAVNVKESVFRNFFELNDVY